MKTNLKKLEEKLNSIQELSVDKMNSIKGGAASCGSRMVLICKSVTFETVDDYFKATSTNNN